MYLSLGRHCDIAFNIKKYSNENKKTQFFDWIRTDFECIIHILNLSNLDSILNKENFIIDQQTYAHIILIKLKNFENKNLTLYFRHDILINNFIKNADGELDNFINKYKRRFERLINLIKSNQKLIFIHRVESEELFINNNLADEFEKALKKINKNVNYNLIILFNSNEKYFIIKKNNNIKINLLPLIDKNINLTWQREDIDWKQLFDIIEKAIL
jgi:hypothetical protein